jgi:hypothetical protein
MIKSELALLCLGYHWMAQPLPENAMSAPPRMRQLERPRSQAGKPAPKFSFL